MLNNYTYDELARVYRADSGRILASLLKISHDFQLAEDALHEACLQAEMQWRKNGVPDKPSAWLFVAAKRRLIDGLRSEHRLRDERVVRNTANALCGAISDEASQVIPDERLALIFTCCHPALNKGAQVALTLKTLCGLSVREIARAFLLSDTAVGQRLVRAKNKIRSNSIAYRVPEEPELASRLEPVLAVIYFIYNESYTAFEGQTLTRDDLAAEAIRLARLLVRLLPEPEVEGLLALLLLHQSRRAARQNSAGALIALEHQDRSLWDNALANEGRAVLEAALAKGKPDKYQIQAAISALHVDSDSWGATDWAQIIGLYRELVKKQPSSITRLNLYCAVAHSGEYGLAKTGIESLQTELENYQPYYAALADIERRLGNANIAKKHYQRAISLCSNHIERTYLRQQLYEISN